ncbi:MAG: hypothetical protein AAGE89_05725 [Pseudomonadota bacterium]
MQPEGTEPHFVLPDVVYEEYRDLIDQVTQGEFNQNAMYNVVFLYTDPEDARRAGTLPYGTDSAGLIAAYSNFMEQITREPDPIEQLKMFKGAHSYFREALFVEKRPGVHDPCASKNPLPSLSKTSKRGGIFKRRIFGTR